jgi:hypothetical protein
MTAPFSMQGAVGRSGLSPKRTSARAYNGGLRPQQSLIGAVGAVGAVEWK